ncbi:hypothetical protein ABTZ11_37785, partial [Streptomyces sp. NPDC095817]
FIRVNVVITTVWTAAFGATAVALAVLAHARHGHSATATLVQVLGFIVPVLFTVRYVAAAKTKATVGA